MLLKGYSPALKLLPAAFVTWNVSLGLIWNFNTSKFACHRKLLGYGLSSCTSEELQVIESQLVRSLSRIREKKVRGLQPELNMAFFLKFLSGCHGNMGLGGREAGKF